MRVREEMKARIRERINEVGYSMAKSLTRHGLTGQQTTV